MGNTLMTHHFHKKRKKARENSENNMAERLAPGRLRPSLMSVRPQ